jgi:hypothetical protein
MKIRRSASLPRNTVAVRAERVDCVSRESTSVGVAGSGDGMGQQKVNKSALDHPSLRE